MSNLDNNTTELENILKAVNDLPEAGSGEVIQGEDGGYYTPSVTQVDADTMQVSFTPSKGEMPTVSSQNITLPKGADGKSPHITLTENSTGVVIDVYNTDGTIATQKVDHGIDGLDGTDGVGIVSVKQTYTSTEDDGNNIIVLTQTDNKTYAFTIKNGSKGSDGKSAYAYAQDGGYTGTETQFSNDLATVRDKVDKTYLVSVFEELKVALEEADIAGAIAVLDEAILDLSELA